jgi:HAD superfamily hydrolase (TIGR01509 family)
MQYRLRNIWISMVIVGCSAVSPIQAVPVKAVIYDLGGVLFSTDSLAASWQIGPLRFLHYPRALVHPQRAKLRFFEYLNYIVPHRKEQSPLYDADGSVLPQLMCDWLTGVESSQTIKNLILSSTRLNKQFFNSKAERKFICAMATMIFTPETFIQTRKHSKAGLKFVKECKQKGYKVYVLSNWDKESFALLMQRHKELFSLCDGYVISGDRGCAKPALTIYHHLLEQFHLNPTECLFIDDQKENIQAAQDVGMYTILCPQKAGKFGSIKPDFRAVRAAFEPYQH